MNLKSTIAAAIKDMVLISESDVPLELVECVELVEPKAFLKKIESVEDPDYVKQWKALFLLLMRLQQLTIIRVGKVQVDIFIVGRDEMTKEAVWIHTRTVET